MRISLGSVSIDNLLAYLTRVKESKYQPYQISGDLWFPSDAWSDPVVTDAFRRLSTCIDSCGCTGYSPKNDCSDPTCYCNKDKE